MGSIYHNGYHSQNNNHSHSGRAYTNGNSSGMHASNAGGARVDGDSSNNHPSPRHAPSLHDPNFDILEWHPAYQSCQRYFLDHAQYEPATQAVCALINIRLPFQWLPQPIVSASLPQSVAAASPTSQLNFNTYPRASGSRESVHSPNRSRGGSNQMAPFFVSPMPYLRRLIVTGFDKPAILHGFFGDDYVKGIMPHVECERRNYLFAAKAGGWRSCKKQYDTGSGGGGDESLPFMKPLDEAKMEELMAAEKAWSDWLCMEDWMVGPRAPEGADAEHYRAEHRDGGVRMNRDDMLDGV